MDGSNSPNNRNIEVDIDSRYVETSSQPPPEVDVHSTAYRDFPEATSQIPPQYDAAFGKVAAKFDDTPPEVVGTEEPKERRICRMRRKMFFGLLVVAILIIVGIVVGVAVGITVNKDSSKDKAEPSKEANITENEETADGTVLYRNTRLATLNFTDQYQNDNFIVLYQRQDRGIYMSTFNSSHGKWIVHPIVDGTAGTPLDDVQLGTSISLDLYFYNSRERSFHLYWQTTQDYIRAMYRYMMATDEVSTARDWESPFSYDRYSTSNGSSIVSYARTCFDCVGSAYLWFQDSKGDFTGAQLPGKNSEGWVDRPQEDALRPIANTSMALAYLPAPNGTKAYSVFYQAQTGVLNQFIFSAADKTWQNLLPRELSGNATIAAFATGFNQTKRDDLDPMGFQILTIEPETDDKVLLTYYNDGKWTAADDGVEALSECAPRGVMVANAAGRVYCLVDGDDGKVEIIEFAWRGDRGGDADTFMRYDRIGPVKTALD